MMYVNGAGIWTLVLMTLLAFFIGYHLIMGIGGADMPVVVSMLNSYSGWAAAAIGFTLGNDLLIVTGALVGSSGAILSYIMCKAMNRNFISRHPRAASAPTTGRQWRSPASRSPSMPMGVASALERRRQRHHRAGLRHGGGAGAAVGVGADAQAAAAGKTGALRHPSRRRPPAGAHERAARRSQGALRHRAGDGRDQRGLPETDVVIVIGSNDIVNPAAQEDPKPDRRHAGAGGVEGQAGVRVQARQGTGYSGIENPLFYKDNTRMFYGDAKSRSASFWDLSPSPTKTCLTYTPGIPGV
jgi:NAD(P) transhydrogenase subunit beta